MSDRPDSRWTYTQYATDMVKNKNSGFEQTGFLENKEMRYQGRHIIGRDTRINGGVLVTVDRNLNIIEEAVVVDDKNSQLYTECYEHLLRSIKTEQQKTGKEFKELALEMALAYTQWKLPYDESKVDTVVSENQPGAKVDLSVFIEEGAGICRHQGLFLGYLLERMIKERKLNGRVSVDSNVIPGIGGHTWVRYVTRSGRILILDQGIAGELTEVNKTSLWDYRRPEEKK